MGRTVLRWALLASLTAGLLACAPRAGQPRGDPLFPNDDRHEAQARLAVQQRAAFDIDCADVEILRLGDVNRLGQQWTQMTLGAKGCGWKATYVVECVSNWGKITCTARMNTKEGAGTTTL